MFGSLHNVLNSPSKFEADHHGDERTTSMRAVRWPLARIFRLMLLESLLNSYTSTSLAMFAIAPRKYRTKYRSYEAPKIVSYIQSKIRKTICDIRRLITRYGRCAKAVRVVACHRSNCCLSIRVTPLEESVQRRHSRPSRSRAGEELMALSSPCERSFAAGVGV